MSIVIDGFDILQRLGKHADAFAVVRADATTPGVFFAGDPQMLANEFAPVTNHTRFGEHRRWGPSVTVNGGLDAYRPGVLAGEHTDAVLAELGYDAAGVADLRARGIVASEPVEISVTA